MHTLLGETERDIQPNELYKRRYRLAIAMVGTCMPGISHSQYTCVSLHDVLYMILSIYIMILRNDTDNGSGDGDNDEAQNEVPYCHSYNIYT